MTDDQFRHQLLTDPDGALAKYELTPVEREAIKETELAEVTIRFRGSEPGSHGSQTG